MLAHSVCYTPGGGRDGFSPPEEVAMKVGAVVRVFHKHPAVVVAVSMNSAGKVKRVHVSGSGYVGWTNVGNVKAVIA